MRAGTGLTLNSTTGILQGTPAPADVTAPQPLAARVAVSDPKQGRAQQFFLLTVLPNQAPASQVGVSGW